MRILCLFIFFINAASAQTTISVNSSEGTKLEFVTVFEKGETNTIVGQTDASGRATWKINEHVSYLFHLLGYEDKVIPGKILLTTNQIVLIESPLVLEKIDVKKRRYKSVKIINPPGNHRLAESNYIKQVIERVSLVNLTLGGFLNTYSLKASQKVAGDARLFRFVLYSSKDGQPDLPLVKIDKKGILDKKKMLFRLGESAVYLDPGQYFIGYETTSSVVGAVNRLSVPREVENMIFIHGKENSQAKTFVRSNFNKWSAMKLAFGYELELLVPVNN